MALSSLGAKAAAQPLRITTTNAFASRWLVPRLSLWRSVHDDVTLSIIGTDRLMKVDAGEVDLAIRYARLPPQGASDEIFRDQFYPVCSPRLLAGRAPIRRVADLGNYPLIHFDWFANDRAAPTWTRWLEAASRADPHIDGLGVMSLSFREEFHPSMAVLAGHGIALCSDIVVADDLASGALVKAIDLAFPGYGYYPLYMPDHPRRAVIERFVLWLAEMARHRAVPGTGKTSRPLRRSKKTTAAPRLPETFPPPARRA